jgi:alpha-tubulin suppressor-like RCC1 family protein
VSERTLRAVCGGSASAHCMAIAEDGRVFTWGRNENGQLGHGGALQVESS